MPSTTATQNLTVPAAGDKLTDQPYYQAVLAGQLENRFNSHAADLARSQVPLFALVELDTPKSFLLGGSNHEEIFTWDSVLADTGGLVDLTVDARVINLNRAGYWSVGCYVHHGTTGCAPGGMQIDIRTDNTTPSRHSNWSHDAAVALVSGSVELEVKVTLPASSRCYTAVTFAGTNCLSVATPDFARMWAYWVRDL